MTRDDFITPHVPFMGACECGRAIDECEKCVCFDCEERAEDCVCISIDALPTPVATLQEQMAGRATR